MNVTEDNEYDDGFYSMVKHFHVDFMLLMMIRIAVIKVNIAQHVPNFMSTFTPTSCSFKSNFFFSLLR